MNDTAKCPYCNINLECDDVIDHLTGGDCYVDRCVGHCPQCNKEFQWEEVYYFSGVENIEEEME